MCENIPTTELLQESDSWKGIKISCSLQFSWNGVFAKKIALSVWRLNISFYFIHNQDLHMKRVLHKICMKYTTIYQPIRKVNDCENTLFAQSETPTIALYSGSTRVAFCKNTMEAEVPRFAILEGKIDNYIEE